MTIEITKLSHDGRGVGRDAAGKTIFIDGTLPGERVTYTVTRNNRRFNEAVPVAIENPAVDRVVPQCEHFLICGGCAQQHIAPDAQLRAKQQSVLEQMLHFGQVQPQNILPPLTGPVWGYRNKARLGVRYVIKKEKLFVGFREKQKNYLAELNKCEILHPQIGHLITPLRNLIQVMAAREHIAQIEVAVGDQRMAMIFRNMVTLDANDQQLLIDFAIKHEFDLYLQPDKPESIYKIWPQDGVERLYYSLPEYDLKFGFYPTDFTQVNPVLNRKMVAQALQLLQLNAQDHVLDLFCGIGNFSLPLAKHVATVTGVEGSPVMVERAYENANLNRIENVSFFAADLTKDNQQASWVNKKYSKALIDPPRSGAAEVIPLLAALKIDMILYVSCNPATFARDSGLLTNEYGYTLTDMGIMDMFPHTLHVETMGLFIKRKL